MSALFGMVSRMTTLVGGRHATIPLALSYAVDWAIIILAAIVGGLFSLITPNKRPFSLADPSISFPNANETISTSTLALVGLVAPAVIIFLVAILFVPGPTVPKSTPKAFIWRRKVWEWHAGWIGLGLSLASAFLMTEGMKCLFGKPRPDLLARCMPDVANISKYAVGGYPNAQGGVFLVSAAICQNPDSGTVDDGFTGFPSGHSSFSAAGLIYLSLFIASKLAITIPFLAPRPYSRDTSHFSAFPSRNERSQKRSRVASDQDKGLSSYDGQFEPSGHNDALIAARNQAAAPPVYLLVFAIIPFFASIYISSTRYSDFKHQGFDILFGYFIGTVTAIFSFRFYHMPISQGAGWAWGPRSSQRSFWAGIGVGSYVGGYNKVVEDAGPANDVEAAPAGRQVTNDVGANGGHATV